MSNAEPAKPSAPAAPPKPAPAPKVYKLGDSVEPFELPMSDGSTFKLADYKEHVVLINFWAVKCPFVLAYNGRLGELHGAFKGKKYKMININSNKTDSLADIQATIKDKKLPFQVAVDKGNVIADLFGAQTTPHVFILDLNHVLAYTGGVDDDMDLEKKDRKNFARDAAAALIEGKPPPAETSKNFGCSIKRM